MNRLGKVGQAYESIFGNETNNEVKVGQVYEFILGDDLKTTIAITDVSYGLIHFINKIGISDAIFANMLQYQNWNLLAEYPTWQEAVNSKEFNGEKL